ncbi:MAG: asparagine synthetase [Solirubrobacterales bacterium]|nr:asparagine synthetase [Solirubrobacterales bacterium]
MSRRLVGSFDPRSGGLELTDDVPRSRPDGALCLLDGQLDNASAVRAELIRLGEDPGSSTEELLAAGARCWGQGLLERMRGDFALLVWEARRGRGFLARDQLGVQPLFVHQSGGVLRFASELRDLLTLLPATPAPDRAGVAHWIALSSRPGTETLYAGVQRLGPGELLAFGSSGVRRRRYWEPRFQEPLSLPPELLAERVREALRVAVERRLDPGGETGVLLSGGLDSASIAALGGNRLRACSGTFPGHPEADEGELIAELRRGRDLKGMVAEVRPGGLVASILEHLAEWRAPLLGWGDFWTLPLLRSAAAKGIGTVLGGDGGDELFGPRVYALADELRAGHPRRVLKLARRLPGAGPHVGRREEATMIARLALGGAVPPRPAGRRLPLTTGGAPPWLSRRSAAELIHSDDPDAWKRLQGPRWWAQVAYGISSGIEATGVFEHQRRRAAMAGVEARHPMLDLDLIELCLRQPPEQTLDPRFSRPVLRAAMAGLVPDSVRLRPEKALFESLIVSSLTGPDAGAVRAILTAPDAEIGAYVDQGRMTRALFGGKESLRGDAFRWMWQVWRLLTIELWLRAEAGSIGLLEPINRLSTADVTISER